MIQWIYKNAKIRSVNDLLCAPARPANLTVVANTVNGVPQQAGRWHFLTTPTELRKPSRYP